MNVRPRVATAVLLVLSIACVVAPSGANAAEAPAHRPLRILIVSDEVNPHGLSAAELSQPGEIAAALLLATSGLNLDTGANPVLEIGTDQIELATAELLRPQHDPLAYDVLIYFAHRIPVGPDGATRQEAFTAAVEAFLVRGGGVVSFHHGIYRTAGKESIQQLLGGAATGAVVWNTVDGQSVIAVAPQHYVACHAVGPLPLVNHADAARGVPDGDYPFFVNVPDERYVSFELEPAAADVEILFASNFDASAHLLGYTHRRPEWRGIVVVYQPGEHEPTAFDPDGPNFQILINAIVWSAHRVARDGLQLVVHPGLVPEAVVLDWSDCPTLVNVHRSADPATLGDPGNIVGQTSDGTWLDTPTPGGVVYYRVLRDG